MGEVTLVCGKFQCSYCKYGLRCRREHVKIICESEDCCRDSCEKRHPRQCYYFHGFGRCKFGEFCLYSHKIQYINDKEKEQVENVNDLMTILEGVFKEISDLKKISNTFKR